MKAPGADTTANELHDASGTGVLPVRTLIVSVVPAGSTFDQVTVFQSTGACASKMREMNAPDVAYGIRRIQSTATLPPNALKSLAAMGRITMPLAIACVAT